jgi:hypothetical protein
MAPPTPLTVSGQLSIRALAAFDRSALSSSLLDSLGPELEWNGLGFPTAGAQRPRRLDEHPAKGARSCLRDRQPLLTFGARALAWHQAQVRLDLVRAFEARHVVDRCDEPKCRERSDTGDGCRQLRSLVPEPIATPD